MGFDSSKKKAVMSSGEGRLMMASFRNAVKEKMKSGPVTENVKRTAG